MTYKLINYLELEPLEKLRFRDGLLRQYLDWRGTEALTQNLIFDRDLYLADENFEMAQAYQDLIDDLKLLDDMVKR